MRDVLLDLVRQTGALTEALRVTGSDTETVVKGCDADKTLFIEAKLKEPLPEFAGEFGITNMNILGGLLNFVNYRTDDATFTVKRMARNGKDTVEKIEFRNDKTGNEADFRMMDPAHIPEQATIPVIPWEVTIVPTKTKVAEFSQIATLYSEAKQFGARTVKGDLQFYIGDDNSSTHRASMVFENGVKGEIKGTVQWNTYQFLAVMKLTGNHPTQIKLTSRGVLGVEVETPYGIYNYFLRAQR